MILACMNVGTTLIALGALALMGYILHAMFTA